MRISDDRYSRDRQRYDLALRFIQHEARTRTIRTWTGLTDDRIRKLYRSYVGGGRRNTAHRAIAASRRSRPPSSSARRRCGRNRGAGQRVCTCWASCRRTSVADAQRNLPGMQRGEALCEAFETYRATGAGSRASASSTRCILVVGTGARR